MSETQMASKQDSGALLLQLYIGLRHGTIPDLVYTEEQVAEVARHCGMYGFPITGTSFSPESGIPDPGLNLIQQVQQQKRSGFSKIQSTIYKGQSEPGLVWLESVLGGPEEAQKRLKAIRKFAQKVLTCLNQQSVYFIASIRPPVGAGSFQTVWTQEVTLDNALELPQMQLLTTRWVSKNIYAIACPLEETHKPVLVYRSLWQGRPEAEHEKPWLFPNTSWASPFGDNQEDVVSQLLSRLPDVSQNYVTSVSSRPIPIQEIKETGDKDKADLFGGMTHYRYNLWLVEISNEALDENGGIRYLSSNNKEMMSRFMTSDELRGHLSTWYRNSLLISAIQQFFGSKLLWSKRT